MSKQAKRASLVVASMHRALGVSGVSVAGARMAALCRAAATNPAERPETMGLNNVVWIPVIVGTHAQVGDERIAASALGSVEGSCVASWPDDATPVQQALTVREALRTIKADVVVTNDCPPGFVAGALDAHLGLKTALWHHSSGRDGDDIVLRCGALADVWCSVSEDLTRRVRDLGVMRSEPCVEAMPAYVEVEEAPRAWLPNSRTIRLIYAGRLENQHKRVMDLAVLADELHKRGVRFRLTIVGEGTAEASLREAIKEHLKSGRIAMTGRVAYARMADLYAAHDAGLLVSASEGMPLTALECMAVGRPVAMTRGCGGLLSLIKHEENGMVVDVGDMKGLADQLEFFATRRERLGKMGRAAFETARRSCSAAAVAGRYAAFIFACGTARGEKPVAERELPERWRGIRAALEAIGECGEAQLVQLRDLWAGELFASGVLAAADVAAKWPCAQVHTACSAERRCSDALAKLRGKGVRRVALYGAGRHTQRLRHLLAGAKEIVAIVDDRAGEEGGPGAVMFGLPVVKPERIGEHKVDAILVSSEEFERVLCERAKTWCGGMRVVSLYSDDENATEPEKLRAA